MTQRCRGPAIAAPSTRECSPSTAVAPEAKGNARDINFDPLVLPPGIEPSDDPLLSARSAVYAASFRRRAGENTL